MQQAKLLALAIELVTRASLLEQTTTDNYADVWLHINTSTVQKSATIHFDHDTRKHPISGLGNL